MHVRQRTTEENMKIIWDWIDVSSKKRTKSEMGPSGETLMRYLIRLTKELLKT